MSNSLQIPDAVYQRCLTLVDKIRDNNWPPHLWKPVGYVEGVQYEMHAWSDDSNHQFAAVYVHGNYNEWCEIYSSTGEFSPRVIREPTDKPPLQLTIPHIRGMIVMHLEHYENSGNDRGFQALKGLLDVIDRYRKMDEIKSCSHARHVLDLFLTKSNSHQYED